MRSYTTESYRGVSLPILQLNLTWKTFAFWKENIKCFFSQSECFLLLSLSKMTVHCSSSSYSAGGRQDGCWNHSLRLSFCRTQLRTSLSCCFSLSFHNSSRWVRNAHKWARELDWHSSRALRWAEFRTTPCNSKQKLSSCFTCTDTHHTHLGPFTTDTIPPTSFDTLNGILLMEQYEESCERRNFFGVDIQFVTWFNMGWRN